MDPTKHALRTSMDWLPRTRGDGPASGLFAKLKNWAPPHTRGWTPCDRRLGDVLAGSPAHAGMDPQHRCDRGLVLGLPRTRGDGPQANLVSALTRLAPPHTRGWTLVMPWMRDKSGGSPAHAGMDHRYARNWAPLQRFL